MKNKIWLVIFAGVFVAAAASHVLAQEKAKEELMLEAAAGELDKNYSEGRQRVADRLKAGFGVNDALLTGLHFRNMSNGEIAIALGLAERMRRGITDKNLHTIVALREGPPVAGWGKIAGDLGIKLGPVISRLRQIAADVRRQEKSDTIKKDRKTEAEKVKKNGEAGRQEKTGKTGMKSMVHE